MTNPTLSAAVARAFEPSPQQADFFNWIETGEGSCVLEAVAGSGKTTTLIEALKLMKGYIFFGAYNKKIADEIQARAPKQAGLFISTMHAAGFRAWRRNAANVKVEQNKCRDLFRASIIERPLFRQYESPVLALVSYAKQAALGVIKPVNDANEWRALIDHFDLDCLDNDEQVIMLAQELLAKSVASDHLMIDFDDMIYAPLVHKAKMYEYDWVLIDEAQDTNASRRALALCMLRRGGRLVAVGDRHQAIYGFTGADADALDRIAQAVSAVPMPLTVTYRCPRAVVAYAQQYVSHIVAHDSAPEGEVQALDVKLQQAARVGDAVLCRFTAPLIKHAYAFIAAGVPARVEGREIGAGLKQLARRWKVKTYATLQSRLEDYLERECAKYRAKEQESRAAAIEDRVECLNVLINRIQRTDPHPASVVERLCDEIDSIFGDSMNGDVVLLSTIHKSKGREWNTVYWLQTGPSKWARKEWELEQEINLCYVAATRAKRSLILINEQR